MDFWFWLNIIAAGICFVAAVYFLCVKEYGYAVMDICFVILNMGVALMNYTKATDGNEDTATKPTIEDVSYGRAHVDTVTTIVNSDTTYEYRIEWNDSDSVNGR